MAKRLTIIAPQVTLIEKVRAYITLAKMGLSGNLSPVDWLAVLEAAEKELSR